MRIILIQAIYNPIVYRSRSGATGTAHVQVWQGRSSSLGQKGSAIISEGLHSYVWLFSLNINYAPDQSCC